MKRPLATLLFAVGLVGAAVLAAAILPLSTAYSVCEFTGSEAALDDTWDATGGLTSGADEVPLNPVTPGVALGPTADGVAMVAYLHEDVRAGLRL